jgi:hypothetical protein
VQAHGLVERFSRYLDVATENPAPMQEIVASLTAGLSARGWRTTHVQTDPLSGRFLVTDPDTGRLPAGAGSVAGPLDHLMVWDRMKPGMPGALNDFQVDAADGSVLDEVLTWRIVR